MNDDLTWYYWISRLKNLQKQVAFYNISLGVFFSVSVLNTATMKEGKENALDFN